MMTKDQGEQTKKLLEQKTQEAAETGLRVRHEFVWYEGARHGFAVRADKDDKDEARRGKKAESQAIKWFGRQFDIAKHSMNLKT